MQEQNLYKKFSPPRGSQERFQKKLQAAVLEERRELLALQALAGTLAASLCLFFFIPSLPNDSAFREAKLLLEEGAVTNPAAMKISSSHVEYRNPSTGMRLYWLFR